MKIKNLEVKQTIKNYKELCNILNEKVKSGKSKQLQLKDFERYFKYHKEGNKFIIDQIYNKPKKKINNRKPRYFKCCKMDISLYQKKGVYKIVQDNKVYIGSTIHNFRRRFLDHKRDDNTLPTKDMLLNEGYFDVIWIAPNNATEKEIREKENKYINYYKNNKNWICVNKNDAWVMKNVIKVKKPKFKKIKINKKDYKKAVNLLLKNNIDFISLKK
jgi:hypothetical protein